MTLRRHNDRAFTLVELLTAIAIMLILAALLLPALQNAYGKGKRIVCTSNLKQAGMAFHAWAHDHGDLFPMQVSTNQGGTREFAQATALNPDFSSAFRHFQSISNELAVPKVLACPADRQRFAATNFESLRNENVSYWINPAAVFGLSDSPLAGDRNVRTSARTEWTFIQFNASDAVEFSAELHGYRGNVLFGDAHVDVLDSQGLRAAFASSSNASTTLSIPRPDPPALGNAGPWDISSPGRAPGGSATPALPGDNSSTDNAGNKAAPGSSSQSNSPVAPSSERAGRFGSAGGLESEIGVVTRLDGSVVTSSIPRQITNSFASVETPGADHEAPNPILEFVQWLVRLSTRGTYWLLLLLLIALIAFELARRRGQRKRRRRG